MRRRRGGLTCPCRSHGVTGMRRAAAGRSSTTGAGAGSGRRPPTRPDKGRGRGGGSPNELGVSTSTLVRECGEQQQARWRRAACRGEAEAHHQQARRGVRRAAAHHQQARPALAQRGLLPLVPAVGGEGNKLNSIRWQPDPRYIKELAGGCSGRPCRWPIWFWRPCLRAFRRGREEVFTAGDDKTGVSKSVTAQAMATYPWDSFISSALSLSVDVPARSCGAGERIVACRLCGRSLSVDVPARWCGAGASHGPWRVTSEA